MKFIRVERPNQSQLPIGMVMVRTVEKYFKRNPNKNIMKFKDIIFKKEE